MDYSIPANSAKTTAALNAAAADAVATLRCGLFSESAVMRIRAAVAILNLAITTAEINYLESRLRRVEEEFERSDARAIDDALG
jgi:hypothetical protein